MYVFLVQQPPIHLSGLNSKLGKVSPANAGQSRPLGVSRDISKVSESEVPAKEVKPLLLLFIPSLSSSHLSPSGEWAGSGCADTALSQEEGARFDNGK